MIKIRHTGLVTNNLKKSLTFWIKYLKFKIKKEMNESGDLIDKIMLYQNVKVKTYKLEDNSKMLLELLYFKNSPKIKNNIIKPYTNGFTHISVTVKNLNKLYRFLKKKNIEFNSKPQISLDGNVMMTYCKTPEGAFLELVEELKK
tara:strand:+ start:660 stop:1094 length:435 start_codon:yes stop_codon:yes gene_type:complete